MRVLKRINSDFDGLEIIDEDIETMDFCECYNRFGQKNGCDCGCHSLENYVSFEEVLKEVLEILKVDVQEILDHFLEEKISNLKAEDIDEFFKNNPDYKSALESVEEHIKVVGFDYWDGSNYKTLYTEESEIITNPDFEEIDDDEEKKILDAFAQVERHYDGAKKEETIGELKFTLSRYQGFYPIATVEEVDYILVYNQNCTSAGEICHKDNRNDTTLYTEEDVEYQKEILEKEVKNSNDLFKHKVAKTIIEYFNGDLYQCEVCGLERAYINVVKADEFESVHVCNSCLEDDDNVITKKGE